MINQEAAIIKSKQFLAKIKGLEIEVSGRPLIDWLNFEPIGINEIDGNYLIKCSINESLFTSKQVVFEIQVNKDTGEISDIKRLNE